MNQYELQYRPLIVASHYLEDIGWLVSQIDYPFVIYTHNEQEISKYGLSTHQVKCLPNRGNEVSSYLKYIVDNYHNLPDHVAFIHGHETSWHQDKPLLEALREYSGQEYWSLNNPKLRTPYKFSIPTGIVDMCWNAGAMSDLPKPNESELHHTISAQFVVTKQSILRNPFSFYENLYQFTMTQSVVGLFNPQHEKPPRRPDQVFLCAMEHSWHYIMTHKMEEKRT